jgi:hypothetical protein
MMEAVRISETSVNFNVTTRRYIPEDSKLHSRCLENLKSRVFISVQRAIFSQRRTTLTLLSCNDLIEFTVQYVSSQIVGHLP